MDNAKKSPQMGTQTQGMSLEQMLAGASSGDQVLKSTRSVETISGSTASFNEMAMTSSNVEKCQELFKERIINNIMMNDSNLKTQMQLVSSKGTLTAEEKTAKVADLVYNAITVGKILGAMSATGTFGQGLNRNTNRGTVVNGEFVLQGNGRQIASMPEFMKAGAVQIAPEFKQVSELTEKEQRMVSFRPSLTYYLGQRTAGQAPTIANPRVVGKDFTVNIVGSLSDIPLCIHVDGKTLAYSENTVAMLNASPFKDSWEVAYTPVLVTGCVEVNDLKVIGKSGKVAKSGDAIGNDLGFFLLIVDEYEVAGEKVSEKILVNILDPESLLYVNRDGSKKAQPIIDQSMIDYLKSLQVFKTAEVDFSVIAFESNQRANVSNVNLNGINLGQRKVVQ